MTIIEKEKTIARIKRDAYAEKMNYLLQRSESFDGDFGNAMAALFYKLIAVHFQALGQVEEKILKDLDAL